MAEWRLVPFTQPHVNFCANQNNLHAHIRPEAEQNQGGEAAIEMRVVGKIIDVDRIEKGEQYPAEGSESSSGKLIFKLKFSVRKDAIKESKKQRENCDGQ